MTKLILKIWPSLIPITIYIFWIYLLEGLILKRFMGREKNSDGEKIVGEKATRDEDFQTKSAVKLGKFSLQNRCFVVIIYMSLALAIFTLVVTAFS